MVELRIISSIFAHEAPIAHDLLVLLLLAQLVPLVLILASSMLFSVLAALKDRNIIYIYIYIYNNV